MLLFSLYCFVQKNARMREFCIIFYMVDSNGDFKSVRKL